MSRKSTDTANLVLITNALIATCDQNKLKKYWKETHGWDEKHFTEAFNTALQTFTNLVNRD